VHPYPPLFFSPRMAVRVGKVGSHLAPGPIGASAAARPRRNRRAARPTDAHPRVREAIRRAFIGRVPGPRFLAPARPLRWGPSSRFGPRSKKKRELCPISAFSPARPRWRLRAHALRDGHTATRGHPPSDSCGPGHPPRPKRPGENPGLMGSEGGGPRLRSFEIGPGSRQRKKKKKNKKTKKKKKKKQKTKKTKKKKKKKNRKGGRQLSRLAAPVVCGRGIVFFTLAKSLGTAAHNLGGGGGSRSVRALRGREARRRPREGPWSWQNKTDCPAYNRRAPQQRPSRGTQPWRPWGLLRRGGTWHVPAPATERRGPQHTASPHYPNFPSIERSVSWSWTAGRAAASTPKSRKAIAQAPRPPVPPACRLQPAPRFRRRPAPDRPVPAWGPVVPGLAVVTRLAPARPAMRPPPELLSAVFSSRTRLRSAGQSPTPAVPTTRTLASTTSQ